MTEEEALRQAILTEPDDHVHRLVLADWLLERADPREAQVRAQGVLGPSVRTTGGIKLVPIPAGTFVMGSPEGERHRDHDEEAHEVRITRPFYLGAHPVTVGQYRPFVRESGYEIMGEEWDWTAPHWKQKDDEPVLCLAWADAVAFCDWLSGKDGRAYRLPTEAEWEYACRAGTSTPFHFGDELTPEDANYDTRYPYDDSKRGPQGRGRATPVGSFPANAYGLYEMHGNVWEWCQDWYDMDFYGRSRKRDPHNGEDNDANLGRVLRGGAWCVAARDCRAALRRCGNPDFSRYLDGATGFRVALSMPKPPPKRKKR